MDVLFQSLNGFFARNYLDCRLRTISNPQNGQCREVVLDTFISIPSLPPPPNAGEHLAHRSNRDQCTILVKSIHLYNFILLAHEFGHHYSDSSHCNDLGNCNEGPFPTSSLFLSRNYNIMDGEICTTMIQNINNASFDLNKIVGMNNTIAQCYEAQTQ